MKTIAISLTLIAALLLPSRGYSAEPNLRDALEKASQCKIGESRLPLSDAADLIQQMSQTREERVEAAALLMEAFQEEGTLEYKDFLSKQLARVGGEAQAPTLGKLIADPELAEMARYALERIAGPAADKALLDALGKISGKTRFGIVNSLGERRSVQAPSMLAPLLSGQDVQTAAAAARALGKIGGRESASILREALQKAPDDRRDPISNACLFCADDLLRNGKNNEAAAIYEFVKDETRSQALRNAAFLGLIRAKGEKSLPLLLAALREGDSETFKTALRPVREMHSRSMTEAIAGALPEMAADRQALLLNALADRGDPAAAPAATAAAKHEDARVRIAALKALARVGDASSVFLLAQAAASGERPESDAALDSLGSLRGADVDSEIVSLLAKADVDTEVQLIRALGIRNAVDKTPVLIGIARGPEKACRLEALKALRQIEVRQEFPQVLELIVEAKSNAERDAAEEAASAVCRRSGDQDWRVAAALEALARAEGPAKASLLAVLGQAGGARALETVGSALKDNDPATREAAVRALADWASAEAMPDLLETARSAPERKLQILALRGYLRLLNQIPANKDAENLLARYKEALSLSPGSEEKKMALSGLSRFRDLDALEFAATFLADEDAREEAAASAIQIGQHIVDLHPETVKAVMRQVIDSTQDEGRKKQAEMVGSEFVQKQMAIRRGIREQGEVPVQSSRPQSAKSDI